MGDGYPTPSQFDGMGAFPGSDGGTILIRNHENRRSLNTFIGLFERPVVVPPSMRYDRSVDFNAGVTKLLVSPEREVTDSFAVLGGTTSNCAGGAMPWGSWITCEEMFQTGDVPHGYVYEVPVDATGPVDAVPIKGAGRFYHEAVAWLDGMLYLTEDLATEDRREAAFYRFQPERTPQRPGDLARSGGTLEALRIIEQPGVRTAKGFPVGRRFAVDWVPIEDPDPSEDTVSVQAHSLGAASFSREEGIWATDGRIYFDCTDGGDAEAGQIWEFDPASQTIELVYESPDIDELEGPDNLTVGPTGDLFICEDPFSGTEPFVRVLSREGRIYDFARALTNGTEFCGACFAPDGQTLFLNQHGDSSFGLPGPPGVTYAIWGPFEAAAPR